MLTTARQERDCGLQLLPKSPQLPRLPFAHVERALGIIAERSDVTGAIAVIAVADYRAVKLSALQGLLGRKLVSAPSRLVLLSRYSRYVTSCNQLTHAREINEQRSHFDQLAEKHRALSKGISPPVSPWTATINIIGGTILKVRELSRR